MAKGYAGIILRVDFTAGRIERVERTEVMSYWDGILWMVIRGMENYVTLAWSGLFIGLTSFSQHLQLLTR